MHFSQTQPKLPVMQCGKLVINMHSADPHLSTMAPVPLFMDVTQLIEFKTSPSFFMLFAVASKPWGVGEQILSPLHVQTLH